LNYFHSKLCAIAINGLSFAPESALPFERSFETTKSRKRKMMEIISKVINCPALPFLDIF
jgi:hypothetical protein